MFFIGFYIMRAKISFTLKIAIQNESLHFQLKIPKQNIFAFVPEVNT